MNKNVCLFALVHFIPIFGRIPKVSASLKLKNYNEYLTQTYVLSQLKFIGFYARMDTRTEMFFFIKYESCDGSDRTVK